MEGGGPLRDAVEVLVQCGCAVAGKAGPVKRPPLLSGDSMLVVVLTCGADVYCI